MYRTNMERFMLKRLNLVQIQNNFALGVSMLNRNRFNMTTLSFAVYEFDQLVVI